MSQGAKSKAAAFFKQIDNEIAQGAGAYACLWGARARRLHGEELQPCAIVRASRY